MKNAIKKNRVCLQSLNIMKENMKQYAMSEDFDYKVFADMMTEYMNAMAIYDGLCKI